MTDSELIDGLERVIREHGPHNFFLVLDTGKFIAVQADIIHSTEAKTDTHANIRQAIRQLVTSMDEIHRGSVH